MHIQSQRPNRLREQLKKKSDPPRKKAHAVACRSLAVAPAPEDAAKGETGGWLDPGFIKPGDSRSHPIHPIELINQGSVEQGGGWVWKGTALHQPAHR